MVLLAAAATLTILPAALLLLGNRVDALDLRKLLRRGPSSGSGTSRVANTKMLGLGIALALLMDAVVVRTLLVPAIMKLTGRATAASPVP